MEQVRVLACRYGRADIGDQMIGQLLSHCSASEVGVWPCEPVRDVIEGIASSEIAIGMSIGIRNALKANLGNRKTVPDTVLLLIRVTHSAIG